MPSRQFSPSLIAETTNLSCQPSHRYKTTTMTDVFRFLDLPAELQVKTVKYYFGTFDIVLNQHPFRAAGGHLMSHNIKTASGRAQDTCLLWTSPDLREMSKQIFDKAFTGLLDFRQGQCCTYAPVDLYPELLSSLPKAKVKKIVLGHTHCYHACFAANPERCVKTIFIDQFPNIEEIETYYTRSDDFDPDPLFPRAALDAAKAGVIHEYYAMQSVREYIEQHVQQGIKSWVPQFRRLVVNKSTSAKFSLTFAYLSGCHMPALTVEPCEIVSLTITLPLPRQAMLTSFGLTGTETRGRRYHKSQLWQLALLGATPGYQCHSDYICRHFPTRNIQRKM